MDSTTIVHANGTTITTTSTAPPRPVAKKISGTEISKQIREELKDQVKLLQDEHSVTPGLAVVLVGERPDSATYVRMKKKAAAEIGFHSVDVTLPDTSTTVRTRHSAGARRSPASLSDPTPSPACVLLRAQEELLAAVKKLNEDPTIHGILVQLPLPDQCDEPLILKEIAVHKDADGFSVRCASNSTQIAR
jgi:5,10-methylene-tetrahydrofolate dehydrogenase/methenyl tetrahydrofolate cyclohydrolase